MLQPGTWRILHVDDDEEDHLIVRAMLREAKGQTVVLDWAATLLEGRQKLAANHYEAVLVDYDLGSGTGIELIREFTGQGYPAPLILLTGRGGYDVDVEAMRAGATLYLTKNEINPLLLERSIRYAIEHKQTEEALRQARDEARRREELLQQRNEALRQSEEKFARAFATNPAAIAITRLDDGRIIDVNETWQSMFGYSRDEAIGTWISRRLWPSIEDRPGLVQELREKGSFYGREQLLLRRSGEAVVTLASAVTMWINGEEVILSTWLDITERKGAEQVVKIDAALRASEARLRDFLDKTHDLFFILDHAWHLLYTNRRFNEVMGTSSAELAGKNFWQIFPRYLGTPVEQQYRKAMQERISVQFESGGVYTPYWYEISVYPTQEGISVFAVDRTEQHRTQEALRASENRFRVALASAPISVYTTDRQLRLTWMHDYRPGFQPDSVLGLRLDQLVPGEYGQTLTALQQAVIETGEARQGEIEVWTTGEQAFFTYYIDPLRDAAGQITGLACAGYDITAQKQTEKNLARYAQELERSNQALQEFAFITSHDLQEPLRKIILFGNSLRRYLCDTPDQAAEAYLQRMQHAAQRMQAMIAGLLDLSRVNTDGSQFERIDLTAIAREVVSDLEARIHSSGGTVVVGVLPYVEGDALQLRQLLQNLVGNALKFHQPGTAPLVEISGETLQEGSQHLARIVVADNGIGFAEEQAEKVFQPFVRLHPRSQYEGSGIGLAICRKIVERHGGSITASSRPGQGCRFIILLPAA